MLNRNRPIFWVLLTGIVLCVLFAVFYLADPGKKEATLSSPTGAPAAAAAAKALETDSVVLFDPKTVRQLTFVGCAYEGKYGLAVFRQEEAGAYRLVQTIKYEKLSRQAKEIWIKYYVDGDTAYWVAVSANQALARVEWTGDYTASFPVDCCPAVIVAEYLSGSPNTGTWSSQYRWYTASGEELDAPALPESSPAAITPGAYVSKHCLYMNPLSSVFPDDDSGYRYVLGLDSFTVYRKDIGEEYAVCETVAWDWQPVSAEEWNDLFIADMAPDIEPAPAAQLQVVILSPKYRLYRMNGEYWLMQVSNDPRLKTYAWSIYSLTPEP